MSIPKFPIGGARQPVYNYLRQNGFIMSDWSDKHWSRHDGLKLHLYGSGSMAKIYDKTGALITDDRLDTAVSSITDERSN